MSHSQPRLPLALRVIAAGCVMLWVASVSACNLEALFCCDSPGDEAVGHTDEGHLHRERAADAEARPSDRAEDDHSNDADGHPHGSHKHESKDGSCCSTLKAVVPSANPAPFGKLALRSISFLSVLLETHVASLVLSDNVPIRQTKPRDWVFTPEVCLGPAHRSLAPPAFV